MKGVEPDQHTVVGYTAWGVRRPASNGCSVGNGLRLGTDGLTYFSISNGASHRLGSRQSKGAYIHKQRARSPSAASCGAGVCLCDLNNFSEYLSNVASAGCLHTRKRRCDQEAHDQLAPIFSSRGQVRIPPPFRMWFPSTERLDQLDRSD